MRYRVFLDVDRNLGYRTEQFLTENPEFISQVYEDVLISWRIDTEDKDSLVQLFSKLKTLELKSQEVVDLAKSLGVDLMALKQYKSRQSSAG